MRSAAQIFYLAVFTLFGPVKGTSHASKSSLDLPDACAINPKATVSDACASYATLDALNDEIAPSLQALTQDTDFFAYYRLNLFNKQCPFWSDENGMCGNVACAVNTLDSEEDIPLIWRAEELGKLEGPKAGHPGKKEQQKRPKEKPLQGMLGDGVGESCVVEYDDECDERDYCVPEDEGATAKGDYVSLVDNPERFTGYSGPGAHQVWDAIYRENCFLKPVPESQSPDSSSPFGAGFQAAKDFRNVIQQHEKDPQRSTPYPLDDECLEKRVFHRLISGMHASISTHLCWDYFNQSTGQWLPNVECFKERLYQHPERISNLYFNFAVVVRAMEKLNKHLQHYSFCTSDPEQDRETKNKVYQLEEKIATQPHIFDESVMFQDESWELKEDFRNRFRNVSRLMDCIGCDKCRLWGKLQTNGYGAALKVLFEFDETKNGENPPLRRTELVALVNTLGRISKSLDSVRRFRQAVESGNLDDLPVHRTVEAPHRKEEPLMETVGDPLDLDGDDDYRLEDEDVWASIMDELTLVYKAFKFVIKSWISLPRLLFEISVVEIHRLWNYYLGFPVPPRSWAFHYPTRDEL